MKDKNFLNKLDDWGSILTDTYENAAGKGVTLELLQLASSWDYVLVEEREFVDVMEMSNSNFERFSTITFKDIYTPETLKIRKNKMAGFPDAYEIHTIIDNVLFDGKHIIDKFKIAPEKFNSDKNLTIITEPGTKNISSMINTSYKNFGKTELKFRLGINLDDPIPAFQTILLSPLFKFNSAVKYDSELKKLLKK